MAHEYSAGSIPPSQYASILLYGKPRTKKTRTACTIPGRKFLLDFDRAAWAVAGDLLKPNDTVFVPDEWPEVIDRMVKLTDEFAKCPDRGPFPYQAGILDSGTEGYDMVMNSVLRLPRKWGSEKAGAVGLHPADSVLGMTPQQAGDAEMMKDHLGKTRRGVAELRDYALAHERWLGFLRECKKLPWDLILICHEYAAQDEDTKVVSGGVMLPGKMVTQTPLRFDYYFRLRWSKPNKEGIRDVVIVTEEESWWPAGYRRGNFAKEERADLKEILGKAGFKR